MFGYEILDLKTKRGLPFFYNKRKVNQIAQEIEDLLEDEEYLNSYNLTKKMLFFLEIKTNNAIEDITDDLEDIENIILKRKNATVEERQRIINVFKGYKYILSKKEINKENLRTLYQILSHKQLDDYSKENMGDYYRNDDVYILRGGIDMFSMSFDKGIDVEKINSSMKNLLSFLKSDDGNNRMVDYYIKSQIIHFYFVYIHPYYDVNGRCARTLSLWYLLNNKAYPFTIFNRGISLDKVTYKNNIRKACHGDLTPFLEFVLKTVKKELEKEAVIYNIKENSQIKLTHEDYEMLEYVFTSKDQTLDEVYSLFCKMNGNKLDKEIWVHRIMPLIEKGIIIFDERNNKIIINKELITLSDDKVKKLSMDKYLI